ncbi:hypothetical protein [Paraburkholderia antibiotica]|uniref:Uncharacterized protein n=1 Tax=Paraburkholderia antibiotica TaxID=2728839 RepID=A0A7Y0FFS0_9BURK|nr:hypothetical protein [Paraburkholderia antibiotica]NML34428.1 hypothetical protein [Paraburkholderia antibiotica]
MSDGAINNGRGSAVPFGYVAARNGERHCRDFCEAGCLPVSIAQALTRRRLDDRPVTQQLRGFANAYLHARTRLVEAANVEADRDAFPSRPEVEAYLASPAANPAH